MHTTAATPTDRLGGLGGDVRAPGNRHERRPAYLNDADRRLLRTDAVELPPTGRSMYIDGVVVLDLVGGLITAERHFLNLAGSHEQLLQVGS